MPQRLAATEHHIDRHNGSDAPLLSINAYCIRGSCATFLALSPLMHSLQAQPPASLWPLLFHRQRTRQRDHWCSVSSARPQHQRYATDATDTIQPAGHATRPWACPPAVLAPELSARGSRTARELKTRATCDRLDEFDAPRPANPQTTWPLVRLRSRPVPRVLLHVLEREIWLLGDALWAAGIRGDFRCIASRSSSHVVQSHCHTLAGEEWLPGMLTGPTGFDVWRESQNIAVCVLKFLWHRCRRRPPFPQDVL